jgi:mono/diheme cytochrome c family protein
MRRTLLTLLAVLVTAFLAVTQDTQNAPKPSTAPNLYSIPLAAAHKENPVKPSSESWTRGKRQYGYDCAMCHGKGGDGRGDVAADMKLKMHDQIDPATLKDRTDGELFYIIKNGKDQMPPEGDRVKDEAIWDMVNYVRTFAKKTAGAPEKAEAAKPEETKPADDKTPN